MGKHWATLRFAYLYSCPMLREFDDEIICKLDLHRRADVRLHQQQQPTGPAKEHHRGGAAGHDRRVFRRLQAAMLT